jgi:hypothetical protein
VPTGLDRAPVAGVQAFDRVGVLIAFTLIVNVPTNKRSAVARCRRKIGGEADELGLDARDGRHGSVRLQS